MALPSMSLGSFAAFEFPQWLNGWFAWSAPRRARAAPDLSRFLPDVRELVAAEAAAHPRLADLASSCPAALVAIACPEEEEEDIACAQAARALAIAGRPLAEICAAAQVAYWLRRARPETFGARPPRLPDTPAIRRRIANHVPTGDGETPRWRAPSYWLDAVAIAFETGDEAVGLWAARAAAEANCWMSMYTMRVVALWAWFSLHAPEMVPGPRWTPDLGWERADELAYAWRGPIAFGIYGGPPDWARVDAEREGYRFTALLDCDAIIAEGEIMEHCIGSYAYAVAIGECALWRVSKEGAPVATLELGELCESQFVGVRQLYGPKNAAVEPQAWRAAMRFALEREAARDPLRRMQAPREPAQRAWEALFEPYWKAKGGTRSWAPHGLPHNGFPVA